MSEIAGIMPVSTVDALATVALAVLVVAVCTVVLGSRM